MLRIQDPDLENYLADLQQRLSNGFYLAGWVGYDFGAMPEGMIGNKIFQPPDGNFVLSDLGVLKKPYRFDHHTGKNNFPFEFDRMIR